MHVTTTPIAGLLVVESETLSDQRGFFRESYRLSPLEAALGRTPTFHQSNHSRSKKGVLRGFHNEAWDKLVYVVHGTAFVAVADVRPDSPTFGQTYTILVGDEPGRFVRIFIEQGLSNAFFCMTSVDYVNDVSAEFDSTKRGGVLWSDPTLGVDWPDRDPILSDADANLPKLSELFPNHDIFR